LKEEQKKKIRQTSEILTQKTLKISSPSLAGQTAIVNQAILLASGRRSSAPSQVCTQWHFCRFARRYSDGIASAYTDFLIKTFVT